MRKKPENLITPADQNDETIVFREAMRGVTPLKQTPKVILSQSTNIIQRKNQTHTSKKERIDQFSDFETLPPVSGEEILEFARTGMQNKTLRNLRNGKYNTEAILDLHGMTVTQARESLQDFLLRCRQKNSRYVLIIHGKGRQDKAPILKNKVNHWLRQTEQVLAFCSATRQDGRGGSLYVLLKAEPSVKILNTTNRRL